MKNTQYIIVELIPEASSPEKGNLVQLSAIKLKGLNLIDRFDYRLEESLIENIDVKEMVNYDKEAFSYVKSTEDILLNFKKWSGRTKLLILDNEYTNNFLKGINNKKEFIGKCLDLEYSDDFIERVINKYKLEPSNYIVDLLYEALIYESNKE